MIVNAMFQLNLTTAVPSLLNATIATTNCTNCLVSTSVSTEEEVTERSDTIKFIEKTVLIIILVACLFGNILLIITILCFKRLRKKGNYFILNLACCDIINAVFSIPFTLILADAKSFPFDAFACKLIYPLPTYGSTASVLTLVSIAVDRFITISGYNFTYRRKRILGLILLVHVIALASSIPYAYHLKYELYDGLHYCYEDWYGTNAQKHYTIVLFLVQYGLPLPIMTILYASAWWKINKQNRKMIKMSEEYERKMAWGDTESDQQRKKSNTTIDSEKRKTTVSFDQESVNNDSSQYRNTLTPVDNRDSLIQNTRIHKSSVVSFGSDVSNNNNLGSPYVKRKRTLSRSSLQATFQKSETLRTIREKINNFRKPTFVSRTSYIRHRQTVRTLTMFTTVLIVFFLFALPNQIIWLLNDFSTSGKNIGDEFFLVFHFLTYVNSVVNCWIYAGFNKNFRKAYKYVLSCGRWKETKKLDIRTRTSTIDSCYEDRKMNQFESRQNAFSEMFKQHFNNFEKFQHLYEKNDEEEEEELLKQQQPQRKRKFSFILNAFKGSSQSLSSRKRSFSLVPPILPFGQAVGNLQSHSSRSGSISSVTKPRERKYSLQSLPVSLTPALISPEVTTYISDRHRRSSTPSIGLQRSGQQTPPPRKDSRQQHSIESGKVFPSSDLLQNENSMKQQQNHEYHSLESSTQPKEILNGAVNQYDQKILPNNKINHQAIEHLPDETNQKLPADEFVEEEEEEEGEEEHKTNGICLHKFYQNEKEKLNYKKTPITKEIGLKLFKQTPKVTFNQGFDNGNICNQGIENGQISNAETLRQRNKPADLMVNYRTRKKSLFTIPDEAALKTIVEDAEHTRKESLETSLTDINCQEYSRKTKLTEHVFGQI